MIYEKEAQTRKTHISVAFNLNSSTYSDAGGIEISFPLPLVLSIKKTLYLKIQNGANQKVHGMLPFCSKSKKKINN